MRRKERRLPTSMTFRKVLANTFVREMSVAFIAVHRLLPELFPERAFSIGSTVTVTGKPFVFDFWCAELRLAIHYYSTCLHEREVPEREE